MGQKELNEVTKIDRSEFYCIPWQMHLLLSTKVFFSAEKLVREVNRNLHFEICGERTLSCIAEKYWCSCWSSQRLRGAR